MRLFVPLFIFKLGLLLIFLRSYEVSDENIDQGIDRDFEYKEEVGLVSVNKESYFINIDYFHLKNGLKDLKLKAQELILNNVEKLTIFVSPIGETYDKQQLPIKFSSKYGEHNAFVDSLKLEGKVEIQGINYRSFSDFALYTKADDLLSIKGNVRTNYRSLETGDDISIEGHESLAHPNSNFAKFTGSVYGKINRKRKYEESYYFSTEILEWNGALQMIKMEGGNAKIWKEKFTATANRGEISLTNYNKRLKYFVLYDNVQLNEFFLDQQGILIERKAFGEKLVGIQSEQKLILTGYPKVIQGEDIIKGNEIILTEDNDVIEVDDANSNILLK